MSKILNVYFHDQVIGQLEQDKNGDMNFTYSASWLHNPKAIAISCSLPLQENKFKRKECTAFFGGILPEEMQRKIIAKNLGISANNDFSMLAKIGDECAGALTFLPIDEQLAIQDWDYHELTDNELYKTLKELPSKPLLAGEKGVRLSLAGVQDKLAVYVNGNKISIPLNNAPSTHILKPDHNVYTGLVYNEYFCLILARLMGLPVAEAEIKIMDDITYLLIKRYDRFVNEANRIERLHQEDFCQALCIRSNTKYQNEGGPSLKNCFDLIRDVSSVPIIDINKMINAVTYNFLIGNCDAHGKNFSLLYADKVQLSPFYDLVSTLYYPELDKKMAMKIGGEYNINKVTIEDFDVLAEDAGLAKPEVRKRILELIESILLSLPQINMTHPAEEAISKLVKERCLNFSKQLKRFG